MKSTSVPQEVERVFYANNSTKNAKFCSNRIVNTKYTIWNILPSLLFNHCQRFMNVYFLLIGCLQLWREVSPVDPWSCWGPIIIIFSFTFFREGKDNLRQYRTDKRTNSREYCVIRDQKEIILLSEEIKVGDIIVLYTNEECPADLSLLYSDNDEGICYIKTANLDGESTLKQRFAPTLTQKMGKEGLMNFNGIFSTSNPISELYSFEGKMKATETSESTPVTKSQLIQCGTFLKSPSFVCGVVCFTGKETKLGLNSVRPYVKYTKIEHTVDKTCFFVFVTQWVIAFLTGTYANFFYEKVTSNCAYLGFTNVYGGHQKLVLYIRFFLLTSFLIPISMKITIDLCKYVYEMWIEHDKMMVDSERQIHAMVNNSSVIEDLGMIEYIFTDKTGTLTENEMALKKIAIGKCVYGHTTNADNIFKDIEFLKAISSHDQNVLMAIYILSMCHTLKLQSNNMIGSVDGISPEEHAFIQGLTKLGFNVSMHKDMFSIVFRRDFQCNFQLLDTLPFSYSRKRMSVVVRNMNDNSIFLLSKGAYNKICNICDNNVYPELEEQVLSLASFGLRTMVLSYRLVTEDEYINFQNHMKIIKQDSKEAEDEFLNFEQHSTALGCAAIEDHLQQDVPFTISQIRKAGIRIWMLTGDILETSLKIAQSARLIGDDGPLFDLTKKTKYSIDQILDSILEYSKDSKTFYLCFSGDSQVNSITDLLNNDRFISVATLAKCVICARATPKHKAALVKAVKNCGKMTLAIGDGGNDVTMIRESHIGVGIIGKEGFQAAASSDFSFTHFRFLQPLILIHGRFATYRTSWLTQFCFYKSELIALLQIFYMFYSGFSGVSFLNSFNLLNYNAVFTLLPVIFYLFDKDVSDSSVYNHPFLYKDSQHNNFLNKRTIFFWFLRGFYQASVLMSLVFLFYGVNFSSHEDGSTISLDEVQQIVYSACIVVVMMTVIFDTKQFTALNFIFIFGTWCLYILMMSFMSSFCVIGMTKEMYLVMWRVITNPMHWVSIFTMVSVAVFPPVMIEILTHFLWPTRADSIRELEIEATQDFQPPYVVSENDLYEGSPEQLLQLLEIYHPPSIWEVSDNLCPFCQKKY